MRFNIDTFSFSSSFLFTLSFSGFDGTSEISSSFVSVIFELIIATLEPFFKSLETSSLDVDLCEKDKVTTPHEWHHKVTFLLFHHDPFFVQFFFVLCDSIVTALSDTIAIRFRPIYRQRLLRRRINKVERRLRHINPISFVREKRFAAIDIKVWN